MVFCFRLPVPYSYIRGLQSNSAHMSSFESSQTVREKQRFHAPKPIRASDWLSPEVIRESANVVETLWAMRDHLLQDSLAIARHLEDNK